MLHAGLIKGVSGARGPRPAMIIAPGEMMRSHVFPITGALRILMHGTRITARAPRTVMRAQGTVGWVAWADTQVLRLVAGAPQSHSGRVIKPDQMPLRTAAVALCTPSAACICLR